MFGAKSTSLAIAAALVATAGASAQVASVGDHPTFTWKEPMLNGQGVKSLTDLQGRPVLLDYWATW